MRVNLDDPRLRAQAVCYLRGHPRSRTSAIEQALNLSRSSTNKLLSVLCHEGTIFCREQSLDGLGRPSRLWSATAIAVQWVTKTPAEMAEEISLLMMAQPWPLLMILPRPGEGMAEYAE